MQFNLISHIVFGLLGIISFYAVWTALLKQRLALKFLRLSSLAGLISIFLSWISGGYYYVLYYGEEVKRTIKAGQYPWAHSLFMEAKEHIFLFLPFLAAVVFAVIFFVGERLGLEPKLKRPLIFVTGLLVVLGIVITLSGMVISGAVG